jgi:D-aspartate ligase
MNNHSAPAFVLSLFDTGLHTLRALAQYGVTVFGFDNNSKWIGASDSVKQLFLCPSPDLDFELTRFLIEKAKTFEEKPILFPASDSFVGFVSRNRNELSNYFLFHIPDLEILEHMLSKRLQGKYAEEKGALVPKSIVIENKNTLFDVVSQFTFPFILKPDDISLWQKVFSNKGILVKSPQQLQKVIAEVFRYDLKVIAQEVIPGAVTNLFEVSAYIDSKGCVHGPFVMQKIRQYPFDLGTGTFGVTVRNEVLSDLAKTLWTKMQLKGFVNTEFKWDQKDQKYKYIETNCRVWQQIDLAVSSGLDLPLIQYLDLSKQHIEPVSTYEIDKYWVDPIRDLFSIVDEKNRGLKNRYPFCFSLWCSLVASFYARNEPWPGNRNYFFNMSLLSAIKFSLVTLSVVITKKIKAFRINTFIKLCLVRSGLAQYFFKRKNGHFYIFNYHRIKTHNDAQSFFDEGSFNVDAGVFRDQILFIKKNFTILSEDDLLKHVENRVKLPSDKNYAMITFDDGYSDNYHVALPILKELNVPAIFFVPTKILVERKVGWWDLIAFFIKNTTLEKFVFKNKTYSTDERFNHSVITELTSMLKNLSVTQVNAFLTELSLSLNSVWPKSQLQDRELMTWEQLKECKAAGMAIGSHSHSHSILSQMDLSSQNEEIHISKKILEEKLGFQILSFAYPVGMYSHFNQETKKIVQNNGYSLAFSFMTGFSKIEIQDFFDIRRVAAPKDVNSILVGCAWPNLFFNNKGLLAEPQFNKTNKRPEKILMLTQQIGTGGLEYQMLNHAVTLKKRGNWIPVIYAYDTSEDQQLLINKYKESLIQVVLQPKRAGFSLTTVFRIIYFCLENKIRIIHSNDLGPFIYGSFIRIFTLGFIKLIHTQHSFVHLKKNKNYALYEKISSFFVNRLCTVSHHMISEYRKIGVRKKQIFTVPNGIHFLPNFPNSFQDRFLFREKLYPTISNQKARDELKQKKYWLLCLGRISNGKGQDYLIDIWSMMPDQIKKDWALCLVGPDLGNKYPENQMLEFKKQSIIFTGRTSEAQLWYGSANLFISASAFEGAPLAPLEALAMNLPVLLSDIEGHQHLKELSQLFSLKNKSETVQILTSKMKQISENIEVPNSASLIREVYSLDRMSEIYEDLYKSVLD